MLLYARWRAPLTSGFEVSKFQSQHLYGLHATRSSCLACATKSVSKFDPTVCFRSVCVTAAGPTENSEKIASRHPVMPVANGLGGGVVGVDSRELGQGNGHDSTVPADQHEHFS